MTKKLSRTKVKRATKVRTSKSLKVKRSRARSARKSPKVKRSKARSARKSPKARSARKVKRTKSRAPVRVKSQKVRRSKSRSAPKVKRTKSPKVKRTSRKSPKARSTSRVRISKVLPPFNPIYNHPTIAPIAPTYPTYPVASIAPSLPIYASVSDLQNAINLRSIYYPGYEFPQWVIDPNLWNSWKFKETIVFYEKEYNIADINKLVIQREPVNIAMKRHYDQEKMFRTFGWRTGSNEIKPNIAIYCNAHIYYKWQNVILDNVHVINLIGFSLERGQPDRKIFVDSNGKLNYDMLIASYNKMWQKLVACAKILKNSGKIKSVRIFAAGAAAFAGGFFSESTFIKNILTPSFLPCFRDLKNADITVSGCNYVDETFEL